MDNDAQKYMTVSAIASISAGFPLRGSVNALASGEVAIVQMRNIASGSSVMWDATNKVELPTKRKHDWLQEGDVIFAARGAKNYAVALYDVPNRSVCSPHFFVLRAKTGCNPEFLAWQINQKPAQEYFKRSATGSHIMNIRREVIEKLRIALPSLTRQRAIVQFARASIAERRALEGLIRNRKYEIEAIAVDLFQNKLKG